MEASGASAGTGTGIAGDHELARNALGLPAVLFCIVTGSAPLAAMMFNDPLAIRGVGIGAPAAFWLAAAALTVFSVGYVEMARRVTTAGGFYSFMSHGFGRVMGLGTAVAIATAYMLFVPGVNGVTSYFATTSIDSLTGFNMDWRIYAFCFIAIMFALTYFHIEIVAKILGFFLIGELIILMIFSLAVLFQGGADGISFAPLDPSHLFESGTGGSAAVFKSIGGAAAGVGFFAAFWSWVGFEMAPNYAEEARNPKKMMAYAIYISCIGLGILYTFVCWMLIEAYGGTKSLHAVAAINFAIDPEKNAALSGYGSNFDSGNIFYNVTTSFVGQGLTDVFKVLIITGSFACTLAFWNTSNRYLFAMGRERILPSVLGKTHPKHKSPFVAAIVVMLFTVMITGLFAFGGAATEYTDQVLGGGGPGNPLVALAALGTWMPFQGNLLLFPVMAVVSLAIIWYFLKPENRDGFHWFKTGVAPFVAFGAISFAIYLMVKNRAALTTGTLAGWTYWAPWIALFVFLLGVALALFYKYRSKDRYEAVGRFIHEEV